MLDMMSCSAETVVLPASNQAGLDTARDDAQPCFAWSGSAPCHHALVELVLTSQDKNLFLFSFSEPALTGDPALSCSHAAA